MRKIVFQSSRAEHTSMRFVSCTAGLVVGGFFLATIATAAAQAQGGEQQPPAQAQGEQTPPEQPQGEAKAVDPATAEQQAQAKAMAEYKEAAAKLSSSAGTPECVWTGRRIASLLWRDDIDTAQRYVALYDRFGCSQEHLKLAFRCVIQQGPLDSKAADRLASRVHNCWIAPGEPTTTSSQASTGSTTKGGTIPN
jgi:hypothetical protein